MDLNRIWYALIDPCSGGYSASRIGLTAMNVITVVATFWLLATGKDPTALITAVVASDATVYGLNSAFRRHEGEG